MERDRVQEVVGDLVKLLSTVGELQMADALVEIAADLQWSRDDPPRRQLAIRRVIALYRGGAASFQDLVLQDSGGVRREQPAFDLLRGRLFEEAREELR